MFSLNGRKAVMGTMQNPPQICAHILTERRMKLSQRSVAPRKCSPQAANGTSRPVRAGNKASNKIQFGYPKACGETQVNWLEGGECKSSSVVRNCAEIIVKLAPCQIWLLPQFRGGSRNRRIYWNSKGITVLSQLIFACLLLGSMVTAEFLLQFCLNSWN